ncbi:MAG: oligosaccharide flippase family protein [Bacteroidota bacterium]
MSILRRLATQTAIFGTGHILAKVLNLSLTWLYTNVDHISPTDYGIFSDVYAFVAMLNIILTFGMETTFFRLIQDTDKPKKIYNQAFLVISVLSVLFLVLIGLLHEEIASLMGYEGQGIWILLMGGVMFLDALAALPMAQLRQQEKARRFVLILLANVVVTVVLNFVFVLFLQKGLTYIFMANLVASAVKLGLAFMGNLPTSLRPDFKILRPVLNYGFFIMIAGLAGVMNETLDRAAIPRLWNDGDLFNGKPMTGEALNGIYAANYKVAILINLAIQAFRYAAEPFFFNRAKEKDSPETFAKIFHFFMIAALLGFLVIGSFAKEIVSFNFFGLIDYTFIGEKYWSGLDIVPILLLAYVFAGAYINISIWFKITKQVRFAVLFTGVGALITILGNFLFVSSVGYYASAWSTLICYMVMVALVYVVGQRYYPIPYRISRIAFYGLIFVGAYAVNYAIGPTDDFAFAFILKTLVTLGAIGSVLWSERTRPTFSPKVGNVDLSPDEDDATTHTQE